MEAKDFKFRVIHNGKEVTRALTAREAVGFANGYANAIMESQRLTNPVIDGCIYESSDGKDIVKVMKENGDIVNYGDLEEIGMVILRKCNIDKFVGKRIKFHVTAYSANYDYVGVGVIKGYDLTKRNPIEWEAESGDTLEFAGFDGYQDFWLSDEDRHITVCLYED